MNSRDDDENPANIVHRFYHREECFIFSTVQGGVAGLLEVAAVSGSLEVSGRNSKSPGALLRGG